MLNLDAPELYYLANFRKALDWLDTHHRDLMDDAELAFVANFVQLPLPSQALLVRLVMRKGVHFRAGKLRYVEIGDIATAAGALLASGWLIEHAALTFDELGALLLKDELATHFADDLPGGSLKKSELLEHLRALHTEPRSLADWCPRLDERLLSLAIGPLCDRLRLMFFGNLAQDWSEFVLADLGIFRYEQVPITPGSRGFRSRQDIDDYLHLRLCREAFEAGVTVPEVLQQLGDFASASAHINERHQRLLLQLAQHLERAGELDSALTLYRDTRALGSRQRQIRVLERLGQDTEALALVEQVLEAPLNAEEAQLAERARTRLRKRLDLPAAPKAAKLVEDRLDLRLPRAASVELAVAAHLAAPDAPVHYVENTLICGLFGLLCWEAIFAPLPGAFFHPFHTGPVDLHRADFHTRRSELFAACLARLDDGSYRDAMRRTHAEKFGIQSPFVFWELLDAERLEQALACLPPAHLGAWFRRLLADIRENRAGMPDLIQFWPREGRYRMIEVKGPGDRLQDNQKRWLAFCAEHGMPVSVCYVEWLD
ncbi:VRR-NUC domain protein [Pseudomonas sp. THAF187a]|uniref:VRR-NUC domain-containing protein n=1 Tax=unclassified Pseudomonas TaxID=196821 RepID=UPI001267AE82|nr:MULTISPECIES: VRR-NUC domain-containing protein [unclassified Pseudomonas]QFT24217.1 VRR-NUC domain protein [Pseudomonas sp. THAF187a]QFT44404.1 VRR-NUC domain protein [Pseudomonas sp. THAF42]